MLGAENPVRSPRRQSDLVTGVRDEWPPPRSAMAHETCVCPVLVNTGSAANGRDRRGEFAPAVVVCSLLAGDRGPSSFAPEWSAGAIIDTPAGQR